MIISSGICLELKKIKWEKIHYNIKSWNYIECIWILTNEGILNIPMDIKYMALNIYLMYYADIRITFSQYLYSIYLFQ